MAKKSINGKSIPGVPPVDVEIPVKQTSMFTVSGWIVVVLGLIPCIMAAHGDGLAYLWAGLATLLVGGILIVVGKFQQDRDHS